MVFAVLCGPRSGEMRFAGLGGHVSLGVMATLHARVKDGHIVVDERSDLPEGTVVTLQLLDGGDEMTDEELADLEAEVDRARAGPGTV